MSYHPSWSDVLFRSESITGASIAVPLLTILLATLIFSQVHRLYRVNGERRTHHTQHQTTLNNQRKIEQTRDMAIRTRAAEAAVGRQAAVQGKEKARKEKYNQLLLHQKASRDSLVRQPCQSTNDKTGSTKARNLKTYGFSQDADSRYLPVYDDGMTVFRHLPDLPASEHVASLLHQLALDFGPIIASRNFNVSSVSEFCCCGDGMEYHHGNNGGCGRGVSTRAAIGRTIAGDPACHVAGYNQLHHTVGTGNWRTPAGFVGGMSKANPPNSIHLRFRRLPTMSSAISVLPSLPLESHSPPVFVPYHELCQNMAHELAHCVYRHHRPEFFVLMNDILSEWRSRKARNR